MWNELKLYIDTLFQIAGVLIVMGFICLVIFGIYALANNVFGIMGVFGLTIFIITLFIHAIRRTTK